MGFSPMEREDLNIWIAMFLRITFSFTADSLIPYFFTSCCHIWLFLKKKKKSAQTSRKLAAVCHGGGELCLLWLRLGLRYRQGLSHFQEIGFSVSWLQPAPTTPAASIIHLLGQPSEPLRRPAWMNLALANMSFIKYNDDVKLIVLQDSWTCLRQKNKNKS